MALLAMKSSNIRKRVMQRVEEYINNAQATYDQEIMEIDEEHDRELNRLVELRARKKEQAEEKAVQNILGKLI